jgi:hypothetical protein
MLNYGDIEDVRRRILEGQYDNKRILPVTPPIGQQKRKKNMRHEPTAVNMGDWFEDAFFDDLYDPNDDDAEVDVAPDYFRDCEMLHTSYAVDTDMEEGVPSKPLYKGSSYTAKDLARFLLAFKARNMKVHSSRYCLNYLKNLS